MTRTSRLTILFLAVAFIADAGSAHAYIDPGTGSILLQGIVGGLAAFLVVIRFYGAMAKQKLVALLGRGHSETGGTTNADE